MFFNSPLPDYAKRALGAVRNVISRTANKFDELLNGVVASLEDGKEKAAAEMEVLGEAAKRTGERFAEEAKQQVDTASRAAKEGYRYLREWGQDKIDRVHDAARENLDGLIRENLESAAAGPNGTATKIKKSARVTAARSAADRDAGNTVDYHQKIYVNAGNWGDGRSDFVLVAGRFIVTCSWLTPGKTELKGLRPLRDSDRKALERIQRFLENARRLPSHPNASVSLTESAELELTKDAELLVFVGDLHMHLFRGSPADNFQLPGEEWPSNRSLAKEFGRFVEYAVGDGGAKRGNVIQVGDCFEVWESQIIMHMACNEYVSIIRSGKPASTIERFAEFGLATSGSERALRDSFRERASPALIAGFRGVSHPPAALAPYFTEPLDLTDADAVENRIRQLYSTEVDWGAVNTETRGNHDNNVNANEAMTRIYRAWKGKVSSKKKYEPIFRGADDCVAIEHGDAFDPMNCRWQYDQPGRAWDKVVGWVDDELERASSFWGWAIVARMNSLGWVATNALVACARMRAKYLHYYWADAPQPIRLVVLGHSHTPLLNIEDDTVDTVIDDGLDEGLAQLILSGNSTVADLSEWIARRGQGDAPISISGSNSTL